MRISRSVKKAGPVFKDTQFAQPNVVEIRAVFSLRDEAKKAE
jgi:hypothetical protein